MLNFKFLANPRYLGLIRQGFTNMAIISFFCLILGFLLGLVVALCRQSKVKILRMAGTFYVDFIRNTPVLVQMYFLFFGLPVLGIKTDAMVTAILSLSINCAAANCEAIRAGLLAVKKSYYECSAALGFGRIQTLRYIVLPIALRIAFKPLTNNFINTVLTTSACFSITVVELMGASKIINFSAGRPFEIYLLLLAGYCCFTFLLSFVSKVIDKKIGIVL